jgi:hypothetical protein
VMAKVRVLEAQYSDKLAAIEAKKKELESRVNAEQKKQTEDAKKKAGDAVKKLFK